MTAQTAWPENVIARYLADAGKALADPTITVDLSEDPDTISGVLGVCRGCGSTLANSSYYGHPDLITGRHWAQEHAETCRAIPKPA
ncbi:hypothetical protein [Streptomyces rubiginosohelvolus]|uniref:Uncharacterized protein n=1 Tax=Streptomyces rubiginosohelvolus TaxID=67362 RepID=A0ABQ3CB87_9ACTN|nr:hypothetical protein [Streptomyces pluricolorescens]GGZ82708.1 hypothetical protein GCM10010328_66410 [Streptomyces pluricolorescens]